MYQGWQDQIEIYENGNIGVHFKFADRFRKIAECIEINTTDTIEAEYNYSSLIVSVIAMLRIRFAGI